MGKHKKRKATNSQEKHQSLKGGSSSSGSPPKLSNNVRRWMVLAIVGISFAVARPLYTQLFDDLSEHLSYLFGAKQQSAFTDGATDSVQNQLHGEGDVSAQPPPCRLVMTKSAAANGEYQVYSLVPIHQDEPVLLGEPVIQLVNLTQDRYNGVAFLLHRYAWFAETTGGQHEGAAVYSIVPGISMLANADSTRFNVVSNLPKVNHDGLERNTPQAGANTHYHDLSKFAYKNIQAGDEILIDAGTAWDDKRKVEKKETRSIDWLVENGMCIDNLEPGLTKDRGHGAFASRRLSEGSVIAPVPVLVIDRQSLGMSGAPPRKQLLLNYCYGHEQSSVLLFPYSPIVNLINHDDEKPNAILRWSNRMTDPESWFELSAAQVKSRYETGLLLELVATQEIYPGDEIRISYGNDYMQAWQAHLENFELLSAKVKGLDQDYVYAFQANTRVTQLRTRAEQATHPYAPNLVTSCFYKYSQGVEHSTRTIDLDTGITTTQSQWNFDEYVYLPRYLRPCQILERDDETYTVEILNSPLPVIGRDEEYIPEGEKHVVVGVPREAFVFTDQTSSTDQHLPYAFRHEIGLPDGVFPAKWLDLTET